MGVKLPQPDHLSVDEAIVDLIEPTAWWALRQSIEPERGNCYGAALHVFTALARTGKAQLAHGAPLGHPESNIAGVRFGHAWVEWTVAGVRVVIDFSGDKAVLVQRRDYYRLGQIDGADVVRYSSIDQVMDLMFEHGHQGPWHEGAAPWVHDGELVEPD